MIDRMRADAGFTLLELLIAIALFALLGLGTYRMLEAVLQSDEAVRAQELQLRELSRAVWAFERDLQQVVGRPIRDGFGDERSALIGQLGGEDGAPVLELTRAGWRNPPACAVPTCSGCAGDWPATTSNARLLGGAGPRHRQRTARAARAGQRPGPAAALPRRGGRVARGMAAVRFRPRQPENAAERLPVAVELNVDHARYGRITRLLRLPDAAEQTMQQALPGAEGVPEPFEGELPQ